MQADFSGGQITSDAGVLLLAQVDQQFGLSQAIAKRMIDTRNPIYITHSNTQRVAQRLYALCSGYEDYLDHDTICHDPAYKLACRKDGQKLAGKSTIQRMEAPISKEEIAAIHEVYLQTFFAAHTHAPKQIVLDFDNTDTALHGHQEGRFYHGYYGHYCYLPLMVFCGEFPLVSLLRTSGKGYRQAQPCRVEIIGEPKYASAGQTQRSFFGRTAIFVAGKTMRWCEKHEVKYILGLAKNPVLLRKTEDSQQQAMAKTVDSGQAERVVTEITYSAKSWDKDRRIICKAEFLPGNRPEQEGKANTRFIVTNMKGDGQYLYEKVYCARGEMENRIKEHQLGLFGDRMSSSDFLANQFRLLMSGFAHLLMVLLRQHVKGTRYARMQAGKFAYEIAQTRGAYYGECPAYLCAAG